MLMTDKRKNLNGPQKGGLYASFFASDRKLSPNTYYFYYGEDMGDGDQQMLNMYKYKDINVGK